MATDLSGVRCPVTRHAVALCWWVIFGVSVAAGIGSRAEAQVVPSQLEAEAANWGAVRVIVELQGIGFVPEASLPHPSAVMAQRQAILRLQNVVSTGLQGTTHLVRHAYTTIPYLALDAGPDALRVLGSMPGVVSAVFEDQLFEPTLEQSVPLIHADQMHALGYDGHGWVVAIVDTGVSWGPFLGAGVVYGACFASGQDPGSRLGDCPFGDKSSFGTIYDGLPCNFPIPSPPPTFYPCDHGTHVAGIAAGNGGPPANVLPRTGVAPGAQFMSINVFSNFNGTPRAHESDIVAGLEHVLSKSQAPTPIGDGSFRIAAVNMSLGGNQRSGAGYTSHCDTRNPAMTAIIGQLRSAGIAVVVSAGNNGFVNAISAPACVTGAISVGSTGDGGPETPTAALDKVSSFSNIAPFVSLLAPGQWITSTVPAYDPSSNRHGEGAGYGTLAGTSMSAPHVTGAIAVLRQLHPEASIDTLLRALQVTGVPVTDRRPAGHLKGQPAAPGSVTLPRINLAAAAFADLGVVNVSTDTPVAAGASLNVAYTVRNQGGQPTDGFVVGFSLVPVDGAGAPTTSELTLATTQPTNGLPAGTSQSFTVALPIPGSVPPGPYRVRVLADATGLVTELDRTNNSTLSAGVVNVLLSDLSVVSVTVRPGATGPGLNVSVVHTLRNIAAPMVTAAPSTSGIYLSRNASFSSVVARIGNVAVPALPAGATTTMTQSRVTIPETTAPGRYVVLVRANDADAFAETARTNNVGVSASLVVGADLLPTVASTVGGAIPGTDVRVTWAVKNQGGAPAASFHVAFKLVPVDARGLPTGEGVLTAPALGPYTLAAGAAIAAAPATVPIPATTPPGAYRIAVIVDALSEIADADVTNNLRLTSGILTVALPDLVVPSVTFAPAASPLGGEVTVTHTVRNLAVSPATAPATVSRLFLSANASASGAIADLGTVSIGAIPPLGVLTASRTVSLSTVPPGVYLVLARANEAGTVVEANTDNNLGISLGRLIVGPDLLLTAATTAAAAASGANVSVTFTVKNAGSDAPAPSLVRFTLVPVDRTGNPIGDEIPALPDHPIGSLRAGTSTTLVHTVRIPASTPVGFFRIRLTADAENTVVEADETNNTRLTGLIKIVQRTPVAIPRASGPPTRPSPRPAAPAT